MQDDANQDDPEELLCPITKMERPLQPPLSRAAFVRNRLQNSFRTTPRCYRPHSAGLPGPCFCSRQVWRQHLRFRIFLRFTRSIRMFRAPRACSGNTYEREAITAFWSRSLGRRRDPLTNVELVGSEARL